MLIIGASELEMVVSSVDWIQFLHFYNNLSFSNTSMTNDSHCRQVPVLFRVCLKDKISEEMREYKF